METTKMDEISRVNDSVTLNRKIGLGHNFQGTVNMPNPETASLVIQCRRLMVVNTRENLRPEPTKLGVEKKPSKLPLSLLRQHLAPLTREGGPCRAGKQSP